MGLWLPIILMCSATYAQTCTVITGLELVSTQKQCFEESIKKAKVAMESPSVFQARPMCQIIQNKYYLIKQKEKIYKG